MQSTEATSSQENGLTITRLQKGQRLIVTLGLKTSSECILHWGLRRRPGATWRRPPEQLWPEGTTPVDGHAARTQFWNNGNGERKLALNLELPCPARQLAFVLHFPKENRWLKCGGKDFLVDLPHDPASIPTPMEALTRWMPGANVTRREFTLDNGELLAAGVQAVEESIRVGLVCDAASPLALHWGVAGRFRHEWALPPEGCRPAGTVVFDRQAVQTTFAEREGLRWLELTFAKPAEGPAPRGLKFVVYQPEGGAWLKCGGKDISLSLFDAPPDPRLPSPRLGELAEEIVSAEMGASSWTLMHRFHLCYDLLEKAGDDEDSLALLFAWLRFSATRHLDWQRSYNTKPRELSHAQDRLTARLAGLWRRGGRRWARLMLTTMGRGGEGQRVRDEILHIMHRNHIKECSGHFIEEWHQKLHNNTTPDDVAICAAYLAFLRSNGDRGTFYRVLEEGGVTRQRLQSFERAIKSDPTFYGDRKDALIGEFDNFLRILKSVHSGTDLESAVNAARGRLGKGLQAKIDGLLGLRQRNASVEEQTAAVIAAREELAGLMKGTSDEGGLRDLLYLDLALEEVFRSAVERQELSRFQRDRLAGLVSASLRNLALSADAEELHRCSRHWSALLSQPRDGRDWALQAKSVTDRMGRWLQGSTDDLFQRLQPKAEYLGAAFAVPDWVVPMFSEEVIRGGPVFPLSLVLRHLDPILRRTAGLGGWQVVSPAAARGKIRAVESLHAVQREQFAEATVLLADHVSGDEEIPANVTAVLTRDTPDLVSHVAVRARNARVLLATCWDQGIYQSLKGLAGKFLAFRVGASGDVTFEEASADAAASEPGKSVRPTESSRGPQATRSLEAIAADRFTAELVGGKSNNLNGLRGRLPEWIRLPASIALPFGACELTLANPVNDLTRQRYESLLGTLDADSPAKLAQLRAALQTLAAPDELRRSLETVWQQAGLPSVPWEQTWNGVRRVWASKWNERAYLSRKARNVPHEDLLMAVLIQQVVPADFAFVLHTVNPLTGNRDELFGEVVLGLGETLVGNYPGRALGFVCRKADLAIDVVSYPSKSEGLYGRGVIFRSDSNGEDLEGFAGAGLYDSYLAEEAQPRALDYSGERLIVDRGFRDGLLRAIARIGVEVERLLGSAQDIEGAVTGEQYFVVQTRPQVGLDNP